MTIHYRLPRFGMDADAVGRLINGDLPSSDDERWAIIDAPSYRIRKLLDEHLRSQAILRDCRDQRRPFILFLRSFSAEHRTTQADGLFMAGFAMHSIKLQAWVKHSLSGDEIPIIKLHGGSDALLADLDEGEGEAAVLSTHGRNWVAVAADLIQSASAIVFLVSDMAVGVVQEFELIRRFARTDRCAVVLLDPGDTPARADGGLELVRARLADFPHVFEFRPDTAGGTTAFPEELRPLLASWVRDPPPPTALSHALKAEFTYLEPSFTESAEFAETAKFLWHGLRLLRVMFDDTYWAAIKSAGIDFSHFTFPGAWPVAHKLYGLGLAIADFPAVREALWYLHLLYIVNDSDLALSLPSLSARYGKMAEQIHPGGPPDNEAHFMPAADTLALPASITTAVKLVEVAEDAERSDSAAATYFYQAAVICALRATDPDDALRRWVVASICRDWAMCQGRGGDLSWATVNCAHSVSLLRKLVADQGSYQRDLAVSLNNLGTLEHQREDLEAADRAFSEALDIRRAAPLDSDEARVDLYTSLVNLGLCRAEAGMLEEGAALYLEAVAVCEERLLSVREAVVDLLRVQGWLSLCLAKLPGREAEACDFARRTAASLAAAMQVAPAAAAALHVLVDEVARVTGLNAV
ncbi:hypothetical protein BX265_8332 [Streptomyces sp. TLI_235]|nr:tetratricopeptide repeat protein [Streptomyces sp. TLI_235]PBC66273.1 hypothetical protein BX265_8332 [Streptomyces sp. TLI_235]